MAIIKNPKPIEWDAILRRPTQNSDVLNEIVNDVFEAVQIQGDNALKQYTKTFDNVEIDDLKVSKLELKRQKKSFHQNSKRRS